MGVVTGMVVAAGVAAAASAYSANKQAGAAKAAGNASQRATDQAISATQANYDRTAENLNPYITAGNSALTQMQALNSGDFSSFKASPDYQFTFDQGVQASDRSAAARGSLYSGGHSADLMALGQGLASQQYGNYYDRLSGLAGMGEGAASNLGSVGTGNAAAIGNYLTGNAANQGAASQNAANADSALAGNVTKIGTTLAGAWGQPAANLSSYGQTNNLLTGGTYTGNGSLATTWPGQNNTSWGELPVTTSGYSLAGGR